MVRTPPNFPVKDGLRFSEQNAGKSGRRRRDVPAPSSHTTHRTVHVVGGYSWLCYRAHLVGVL